MDPHTAVLEVDLTAIVANWHVLRQRHPSGPVAGVIKADGYGLGARQVAAALHAAGCRHFFVAYLNEALAVRDIVPDAMLAVLSGLIPGTEEAYRAHDLTPVLGSLDEIQRWRGQGGNTGDGACNPPDAILHIDTGMSRLGLDARECALLVQDKASFDGLSIRYIMTHLVASETPKRPVNQTQLERFAAARAVLPPAPTSLANSSGIFLGAPSAPILPAPAPRFTASTRPPASPTRCARWFGCRCACWRYATSQPAPRSATTPPGQPPAQAGSPPRHLGMRMDFTEACPVVVQRALTPPPSRW